VSLNDSAGIDILGSLVEPSQESAHPEYYGALHNYGHILLGRITDPKGKFDVSMTSLPDTMWGILRQARDLDWVHWSWGSATRVS
jgi:hypothetical protein